MFWFVLCAQCFVFCNAVSSIVVLEIFTLWMILPSFVWAQSCSPPWPWQVAISTWWRGIWWKKGGTGRLQCRGWEHLLMTLCQDEGRSLSHSVSNDDEYDDDMDFGENQENQNNLNGETFSCRCGNGADTWAQLSSLRSSYLKADSLMQIQSFKDFSRDPIPTQPNGMIPSTYSLRYRGAISVFIMIIVRGILTS